MAEVLLEVNHLRTEFKKRKGKVTAIDDVSFHIDKGEIVGLVGESGCGKSVTSLSIMRLLRDTPGEITNGTVLLGGKNLLELSDKEMHAFQGKQMAMIFQEPMTSLNPVMRVKEQIVEAIRLHLDMDQAQALKHTEKMLTQVGIPDVQQVMNSYPHQLSGGMSQRVMIAMAMSCYPELLIADEPTTALDVTIQAQILDLMRELNQKNGMSILLITHDLGVVAEMCSRVIVMYAGRIVEQADVETLFAHPRNPYTQGLLASLPRLGQHVDMLPSIPGTVPDLANMPAGCKFAPRCKYAMDICTKEEPKLVDMEKPGCKCRCWLVEQQMKEEGKA
ncbi:ABC transporter ATP-binding protein [Caproiciproducens galactitolivorans]|uniref:Oligopeptide transport ATP-binding protein OppD n=1 Tax=Caproiciproducens galactitolivorans TaxID=642589 RepID=A0A4Z0Y0K7_9FIRM|nr:ABC transporter ATP-binding protein [Caproiciproducens galactitolivorans]QEY35558.1 ABC transporter ATP-binding protein [Caproiciproducens galactitolivorans]TGJ77284.1 oligopeptide transport ATP-binding protein OppD [Caproiciproducens galactitolivorans]